MHDYSEIVDQVVSIEGAVFALMLIFTSLAGAYVAYQGGLFILSAITGNWSYFLGEEKSADAIAHEDRASNDLHWSDRDTSKFSGIEDWYSLDNDWADERGYHQTADGSWIDDDGVEHTPPSQK